jgi:hypothetical protein
MRRSKRKSPPSGAAGLTVPDRLSCPELLNSGSCFPISRHSRFFEVSDKKSGPSSISFWQAFFGRKLFLEP